MSTVETKGRNVGGTECSWCKAIRGGTGIAVLSLLITKPIDISRFQTSLHKLQNSHPILRSKLHNTSSSSSSSTDTIFSFLTSHTPFIKIESHNINVTSNILAKNKNNTPLQQIMEHELNRNTWQDRTGIDTDMFVASIYSMPDEKTWVVVMRLHVAACDRTTAVSLLRELLVLMKDEEKEENVVAVEDVVPLAIEDLVPGRKGKKHIWERGLDVLSYSVNSFRFTNLKFNDTKNARSSQVVRMQLNQTDTKRVLDVKALIYFMFGWFNYIVQD